MLPASQAHHAGANVFDDDIVRRFVIAALVWGAIGVLAGAVSAAQLVSRQIDVLPALAYARLSSLPFNALVFAFVGNTVFAGITYGSQRLLRTRWAAGHLAGFHFWSWQGFLLAATLLMPWGLSEHAARPRLELVLTGLLALSWILFGCALLVTVARRRVAALPVVIWFFLGTLGIALVLQGTELFAPAAAIPESYALAGGVEASLMMGWYSYNAVALLLTLPVIGLVHAFVPRVSERRGVTSTVAALHFWALVCVFVLPRPHHLFARLIPGWDGAPGFVLAILVWVPILAGLVGALATLIRARGGIGQDPIRRLFAAGIGFYLVASLELPLLALGSVASSSPADWLMGALRFGALGGSGLIGAAIFYWLVPRLYGTPLASLRAARLHAWLAVFGLGAYVLSMALTGVIDAVVLAGGAEAAMLVSGSPQSLLSGRWLYVLRGIGGFAYFLGFALMTWNLVRTALAGLPAVRAIPTALRVGEHGAWGADVVVSPPLLFGVSVIAIVALVGVGDPLQAIATVGVLGWFFLTVVFVGRRTTA